MVQNAWSRVTEVIFEKHLMGMASLLGLMFKSVRRAAFPFLFNVFSNFITALLDEIT